MMMDLVAAGLGELHERIAGRFARAEPRARVREYVSGRGRPASKDSIPGPPGGRRTARSGCSWRTPPGCPYHLVHARAGLAGGQPGPGRKKGAGIGEPGLISYTLPEIRRLLVSLVQRYVPDPGRVWAWSHWRRRRRYQARLCHYRRRGYAFS
jgi:hypothetical protein